MYKRYFKRLFDVVFSLLALVVLSPMLLLVAIAIRLDSEGPSIFSQQRCGEKHKLFTIYKFRTMKRTTPGNVPTNELCKADSYITGIGAFLRKTSIDELPQLWNILKGDMSFIGPRPALPNQTGLLEWRKKLGADCVKPGLSGWAQVNGRDELSENDRLKAEKDAEYVSNLSFSFDVKCLAWTFIKVLTRQGVHEGCNDGKKVP